MHKPPLFMVLAGFLAASTVSAAAWAQGQAGGRALERMDRNGDGVIEAAEVQEMRAEMFDRLDADGDGFVSREETEVAKARFRERRPGGRQRAAGGSDGDLDRADVDGDGRVSREEFLQVEPAIFQRADTDGDGRLTEDEITQLRDQLRQRR